MYLSNCEVSACYAEFGVRVPHTTGSAYMYSYVTVGEFIAFVIGWNMILEYLIGTSACACALSACFDALTSGAISKTVASVTGTIFGRPPDFLASIITVLMTILIAAGVKKSLVFNNVLNAINLAAWVFIMSAGLFYVNTDNWSQHKGFLPYVPYEEVDQDSGAGRDVRSSGGHVLRLFTYRSLGQVLPFTGTPVFATFCSGAAAAIAALLIKLEVLVEMMSIGTLLAYTLVSTCVLILRYQPHTTNLMDLLPESLRTPLNRSPSKENVGNGQAGKYGTTLPADNMKTSYSGVISQQPPVTTLNNQQHRVMVRKVTRSSSPDSDDTYAGEESEDLSMRDDQFLVSDRNENKFYGSVHAGSTQASAGIKPRFSYISHRLQAATYLCPAIFPWVDTGPATEESGMMVMKYVLLLYILIILFDLLIVCAMDSMGTFLKLVLYILFASIIAVLALISRKPQNRKALLFMTPCVPFVPGIAVAVNIYLIFKLSVLTLVRFTVWMTIGFGVYFYYGIKHSSLEHEPDDEDGLRGAEGGQQNIEMKPPLSKATSPARQPVSAPHKQEVKPEPPARPPTSRAPPLSQRSESLFVPPTEFPTWDD
ncbi:unnamed protein product [Bemisia tabaci]|uniref:Cationic amino acid transporter C-terminal domain-containing protein n=1 Tax=Bemisia tabaci TaxID=7038 RepID=A0A9P0ADK0_BEMTA|nr:unnamed protein product [Bemisia tabaci]